MSLVDGTFLPPAADLIAEIAFPGILTSRVTIQSVEKFAGTSIGTAVVVFRESHASEGQLGYGKEARIRVGNETIFRGTLGSGDVEVSAIRDGVEIMLYDDKWGMQANIIGQSGIGSREAADKGFNDVGFDIVFNKDGLPNKKPGELDFSTGSDAEFWTLSTIMLFIFEWYIDSDVATVSAKQLDGYGKIPSHLSLLGMNALQAVDNVAQLAGESWGLVSTQSKSEFVAVRTGGNATRQAILFAPGGGRQALEVSTWNASAVRVRGSVLNARDIHQAKSAPEVIETMITTEGDAPMLMHLADFSDKKFGGRFVSDVTKYSANGLGSNLSTGSKPKAWLSNLVTRKNAAGSAYLTGAETTASEALLSLPRVEIPVWIQIEDENGNPLTDQTMGGKVKLAVEGYEIDYENGLIDFERTITVLNGTEGKTDKDGKPLKALEKYALAISDFTKLRVWMTVAVVTENPEFVTAGDDSKYLHKQFYVLIDKPDLVPERRYKTRLPDFSTDPDAYVTPAETLETYVSVTEKLEDAATASNLASPESETPIRAEFPLFPILDIGDNLVLSGRSLGPSGNEAVISIRYNIDGRFTTEVEATNITVGIEPERFIKK